MNIYVKSFIKILFVFGLSLLTSLTYAQEQVRIFEHKVQAKETLYGLAKRYNTDIKSIKRLNPWLKNEGLKIGDKLLIRLNSSDVHNEAVQDGNKVHIVKKGETLYGISRAYGVSVEALLRANPSISREHFVVGVKLTIPKEDKASPSADSLTVDSSKEELNQGFYDEAFVNVLLILPFEKSRYYVEFYEGILIALNDLKKQGFSVRLRAEIANNERELKTLLKHNVLDGQDLIIGGTTDREMRLITKACDNDKAFILSPFVSARKAKIKDAHFVQVYQDASDLNKACVKRFISEFEANPIVFLNNGSGQESSFATLLKQELRDNDISFQEKQLVEGEVLNVLPNTIFVPELDDKEFAEVLFSLLPDPTTMMIATPYQVFAYPKWQSFGRDFQRAMHQHNTTIYSSFYLNLQMQETRDFLVKYRAWFDKKVGANYPKYSLLGYDIARYFVRAYALYQDSFPAFAYSLPYDGLQMDIKLDKSKSGYLNKRFYWITFSPNGEVYRKSL